jgi:predicted nucleic acid-binding protein
VTRGLLDTNILIQWGRLERMRLPMELAITTVTLAELSSGVHLAESAQERANRLSVLQWAESIFDPLPFDVDAARAYGRVTAAVRSLGRSPRARVADQMIAAIAISEGLPVFTTNPKDFIGLDALLDVVPVRRSARQ